MIGCRGGCCGRRTKTGTQRAQLTNGSCSSRSRCRSQVYDEIVQLFWEIEGQGIIIEDFYDGCILYDFEQGQAYVCDLDHIHHGAYVLTKERQYGSTRFMAPEEFQKGALIDQRTNVYTMGATGFVVLNDIDERGRSGYSRRKRMACWQERQPRIRKTGSGRLGNSTTSGERQSRKQSNPGWMCNLPELAR